MIGPGDGQPSWYQPIKLVDVPGKGGIAGIVPWRMERDGKLGVIRGSRSAVRRHPPGGLPQHMIERTVTSAALVKFLCG